MRRYSFSKTPDLVLPASIDAWARRQIASLPGSNRSLDPRALAAATETLTTSAEAFAAELSCEYRCWMALAPAALVRAFGAEYEYATCLANDMRRAARIELLATIRPGCEEQVHKIIREWERIPQHEAIK